MKNVLFSKLPYKLIIILLIFLLMGAIKVIINRVMGENALSQIELITAGQVEKIVIQKSAYKSSKIVVSDINNIKPFLTAIVQRQKSSLQERSSSSCYDVNLELKSGKEYDFYFYVFKDDDKILVNIIDIDWLGGKSDLGYFESKKLYQWLNRVLR